MSTPSVFRPPWPDAGGDYLLVWHLAAPVMNASLGRLGRFDLGPGTWVYSGSARGPGGLRARIERHLQPDKTLQWHVDYLTALLPAPEVIALPESPQSPLRLECRLVEQLLTRQEFGAPIRGFGNGDCTSGCPAHLLHHRRRVHVLTLRRLADQCRLDESGPLPQSPQRRADPGSPRETNTDPGAPPIPK